MYVFALLSALVTLAAAFSLISYKVLRLPTTIGVMLLSLATSTLLVISGHAIPSLHARAVAIVGHIDFSALVLHGMLAFLLFAGALQLNLKDLSKQKSVVASLSIFGTLLSTVFVASLLKVILSVTGLELGFVPCLLFGALISPTYRLRCWNAAPRGCAGEPGSAADGRIAF